MWVCSAEGQLLRRVMPVASGAEAASAATATSAPLVGVAEAPRPAAALLC